MKDVTLAGILRERNLLTGREAFEHLLVIPLTPARPPLPYTCRRTFHK